MLSKQFDFLMPLTAAPSITHRRRKIASQRRARVEDSVLCQQVVRHTKLERSPLFFAWFAIVEAHVVSQLVQRIEPHVPNPRSKFLNDIYLSAEDRAIGSWSGLIEAYKQWLDVKLASYDDWKCILAMTDARNAVAHGVGELSRRQST